MNRLYIVDSGYFYAGIIVHTGTIVLAAPILKWCESHEFDDFRRYAAKKRWIIIDPAIHPDATRD
jgi:hypothetical protein